MLTISEVAVTVTIWSLTAVGGFFGIRAAIRKNNMKSREGKSCTTDVKDN